MKTNIANTTDKEIQDIISALSKRGFDQVDEGYVEVYSPFKVNDSNTLGMALYPKLLSYHDGKDWVTIPWICIRMEVEDTNEDLHRKIVKWAVSEFTEAGYPPFKDEDAFAGYSTKEEHKGWVKLMIYVNPDFPKGFWSNHAL